MISHWSFYDKATGIFTGQTFGATDESSLEANTPEGLAAIEGKRDHLCCRVDIDTGEVVAYQPPAPTSDHVWDGISKRWRLNAEASGRAERKAVAFARITHLETNVQPRAIRESALNRPGASKKLQDIDDEIAELRKQLDKG